MTKRRVIAETWLTLSTAGLVAVSARLVLCGQACAKAGSRLNDWAHQRLHRQVMARVARSETPTVERELGRYS